LNPNPVVEIDYSGEILYYNDAARLLAKSLNKKNISEILPDAYQEIVKNCLLTHENKKLLEVNPLRTTVCGTTPIMINDMTANNAGTNSLETRKTHIETVAEKIARNNWEFQSKPQCSPKVIIMAGPYLSNRQRPHHQVFRQVVDQLDGRVGRHHVQERRHDPVRNARGVAGAHAQM